MTSHPDARHPLAPWRVLEHRLLLERRYFARSSRGVEEGFATAFLPSQSISLAQ